MDIIKEGKDELGFKVRLVKRGGKYDVIYCTGFCWKYIVKAVSAEAAENAYYLRTLVFVR